MSASLSQISDWLTTNLPQIIAVIFSSSFGIFFFKFLCNLVTLKIQNKTKGQFSKPILSKIDELEKKYVEATENVAQLINKNNEKFDEKIKLAFENEAKNKAEAYEKIMNKPIDVKIVEEEVKQEIKQEIKDEVQPVEKKVDKPIEENELTIVERVITNE